VLGGLFLSGKYKIIILSIVVLAILAVIFLPQLERSADEQTNIPAEESFSATPNKEPYQDYLAARSDQKPILLEFYARW
jgi:thiol:disulfide interchange protein